MESQNHSGWRRTPRPPLPPTPTMPTAISPMLHPLLLQHPQDDAPPPQQLCHHRSPFGEGIVPIRQTEPPLVQSDASPPGWETLNEASDETRAQKQHHIAAHTQQHRAQLMASIGAAAVQCSWEQRLPLSCSGSMSVPNTGCQLPHQVRATNPPPLLDTWCAASQPWKGRADTCSQSAPSPSQCLVPPH